MVPFPALAEKRVALVIGNSTYKNAGTLDNPTNDAADMSVALKKVGFDVIDGFDLDKTSLDGKVRDFAAALQGANVGLFFYAGHGLQVSGQNYLVPTDAELNTAAALDFEMVRLDLVQRTMERETQTNILFLDACRNNPLARNLARAMGTRSLEIGRGLAPVESGAGTLISFSTQPGNVALDGTRRNSPFTGSLVKHISNSNADLSRMLIEVRRDVLEATQQKQVPWEHSALTGPFYFRQAPQLVGPPFEMEGRRLSEVAEAWTQAQGTKSVAALEAFIARYKDKEPFYAELARERIVELKRATMLHEALPKEPSEKAPTKSPTCPNIAGVRNSWASGFFGRGDTTFTKDGAARHSSGRFTTSKHGAASCWPQVFLSWLTITALPACRANSNRCTGTSFAYVPPMLKFNDAPLLSSAWRLNAM